MGPHSWTKQTPVNDESLVLVSNISPFAVFLNRFAQLGNEGMDTGDEMLLDAIYFAIHNITANNVMDIPAQRWVNNTGSEPEKENFIINWRPDSRRIVIVFTDEHPQSYLRPGMNVASTINAVQGGMNLKVYTFSREPANGNADWTRIATAGNGTNFQLTMNQNQMYENLMSIIDEACLP